MPRLHLALLVGVAAMMVWSRVGATDPTTWALEVFPVFLALPVLAWTYRSFRLTDLLYALIAFHAGVLMVGGHYTYAEVPVGEWARHAFGLARNDYDRFGHLVQGFVPALIVREVLLRRGVVQPGGWLAFIVCSICLAISACYEFLEWGVAVLYAEGSTAFLATQGDPWDTQWDMLSALIGAVLALALLGRVHDRLLAAHADSARG